MNESMVARSRSIWFFAIGQLAILAAVLAYRAPTLWAARWVQDDAYVSFRYARNFVRGDGLVYNPGAHVEGFTNFLWTMLSAVPLAYGADDPLPAMHAFSMGLWAATYLLLAAIGLILFREGLWLAPLAALPLAFHYSFNLWFPSGMETPLVSFLTVSVLLLFTLDPERHRWSLFGVGMVGVALLMTRPDAVFFLAGLGVAGIFLYGRERLCDPDVRQIYLFRPALPLVLVFLPFTAWRVGYYGSIFPNTYYAKLGNLTFYERGWSYLTTYLTLYPCLFAIPFVVLGSVLVPPGAARRFLWGTMGSTAFVFWYVVRLGGDFMEWRFVTPITGILYPAVLIGFAAVADRTLRFAASHGSKLASWGTIGITALASTLFAFATDRVTPGAKETHIPGQETIGLLRRYADQGEFDWYATGRLLSEVLPKSASIASSAAGIIPFLVDRPCLDLCGLTDPVLARAPVDPQARGRMGHEKCDEDYIRARERGIDIYIQWPHPKPYPLSLVFVPPEGMQMVSARLETGSYIEFLVMNDKLDLTAMREDSRLVFADSITLGKQSEMHALVALYEEMELIDFLDLQNHESHQKHDLREGYSPEGGGHNYHEKIISYPEPLHELKVYDDAFIPYEIEWIVHGVRAGSPLVMVVRFDLSGGGLYDVEANGKRLDSPLRFPSGHEAWSEIAYEIPSEFLQDGTNRVRIVKSAEAEKLSELAYLWFLQRPKGDSAQVNPS